jgi:hypothetical protein
VHLGDHDALQELESLDLDCPDEFVYLVEWGKQLFGRSGAGFAGISPVSFTEVEAWSRLLRLEITPLEVEALIRIDAALRRPEDFIDLEDPEPVKDDWGPRKRKQPE